MKKSKYRRLLTVLPISFILFGCESGDETKDEADNLSEAVDYTFTGIEAGSGITELTLDMINDYDNLEGWEVNKSSTAGMITALDRAIENEEPIIVTGWSPHYIFAEHDLKILDDPKNSLGEEETIKTIVRQGLEEDKPNAYEIMDRFSWDKEDMEEVMLEAQEIPFEEAAQNWVDENGDKVSEWTEGSETVDGEPFHLISTPWDTERASSNVMAIVLEDLGYEVDITNVDPVVMFQAISEDEGDASLSPWLPTSFGAYYEQFEGQFEDLGPNMTGVSNGIVVPAYMDIDSVEDLKPRK
ncbi:glycine betaine ABC transporter substrate-binding protein [Alkalibacterium kapii]|uniref:Glycine/betaine ABC transporter substrate-binding protein n=1 Tax=Alkalibacterium kapii TaxID=426704 RepID=A0A511ATR6_9LACT|nr:glycine betaine ABC transporter substrate-binding protein [Alkalibacterium kapii]GEK91112.1 glycine/betaine ABC transporter substrate-binding protein [Alkalibacterium kapii]